MFTFIYSPFLFGQYSAGLNFLKEKKFAEAAGVFQSSQIEHSVLSLMGMSKFYSTTGNPQRALDSAYNNALRAEKLYTALESKEKEQVIKKLGTDSPLKNRQAAEKLYIDEAIAQKKLDQLNYILANIPNSTRTKAVETTRNSIVYDNAIKTGTLDAMAELLQKYGTSLKQKSPELFRPASIKSFDLFVRQEGWNQEQKFKESFPIAGWARDSIVMSFQQTLSAAPTQLEKFIAKYPGTLVAQIALDSLSGKVLKHSHWRYCAQVLQKWPNIPRQDLIWKRLFLGYRQENPSVKQLQAFKTLFPAFPHISMLQEEEKNALPFYYNAVLKSDSVTRMRRFINEYPEQHPMVDTIWGKYARRVFQLASAEHVKNPAYLDAIVKHPKCPKHLVETYSKIQDTWRQEQDKKDLQVIVRNKLPAPFFKFIDRAPASAFKMDALDSLGHLLLTLDSMRAINKYLLSYPNPPYYAELLDRYYRKIRQNRLIQDIENFRKNFPTYQPELVKQDLAALNARSLFRSFYQPSKWVAYHQFIQNWAPTDDAFFALQRIILKDVETENWKVVLDSLSQYGQYFQGKNSEYDDMIATIKAQGKIQRLQPVIFPGEEKYSVYSPALTVDEQKLVVCLRSPGMAIPEDIAISQKTATGWTIPEKIPEFSLSSVNEGPMSISQNATEMLLFTAGKLCESSLSNTGWSEPKALPPTVNFSSWQADSRYIVGNGMIYAAMNGMGSNVDIYVALRDEDGNWQKPINLGPTINTLGEDRTPYLHSDMKTLYFCSTGHPGFGDFDLFVSTRLDDTWTNWSEPKNLGLFFNSPNRDWDFKVNAKGDMGYYSIGPIEASKIVFTPLTKAIQPTTVYQFTAIVLDQNLKPFPGSIQVTDAKTKQLIVATRPDAKNGRVTIIQPSPQVHIMAVPDKDAPPVDIDRRFTPVSPVQSPLPTNDTIIIDLEMDNITLKTILFETGSAEMLPEAYAYLEIWVKHIQKKNLHFEIQGHTDNTSSAEFNLALSSKRANAVRDFLLSKGCLAENISAKGYGESQPFTSNDTEEGKAQNRRVVFKRLN